MNDLKVLSDYEKFKYQKSHQILGEELNVIFTYIEPANRNLSVYGHQIYQLFLRVCTEFEAACKLAMKRTKLVETVKEKENRWNIDTYKKLETVEVASREGGCSDCNLDVTHGKLSDFKFHFFNWTGDKIFQPLAYFSSQSSASEHNFYREYNKVKHNRETLFEKANLENLINGYLALTAILDWQGIEINKSVISVCGNEYITGARFGYFWVTSTDKPKISEKHYF